MTDTPDLLAELQSADMLLIDDLHAWQFDLAEQAEADQPLLTVECMDGRTRRVWVFSAAAVSAAVFDAAQGSWSIADSAGTHVLVCLGATVGSNDDAEDGEED